MARLRHKQLRYGLLSGVLAFGAGWALVTLQAGTNLFPETPRWQATLWVWLGLNRVSLSVGSLGLEKVQPASQASLPELFGFLPLVLVALAAGYTCYNIRARSISHNIQNAMNAGAGYFLAGLLAIVVSNIQPALSTTIALAVFVGAGLWIGSTLAGTLSIPVIGISSLGGLAAIGILVLVGGIAVAQTVWWMGAAAFGAAAAVGGVVGFGRDLRKTGRRQGENMYTLRGLQIFLRENWIELLVVGAIAAALFVGLRG